MSRLLLVLSLSMLSACATLVNGSSQTVTVSTAPPGASCTLDRVGERIGAIALTPGSFRLDKSKNDLSVTCSKEGFETATVVHSPSFSGATFGNLIAGGVVGVVVDAASGANYSYPSDLRLDLTAKAPPVAALVPPATAYPAQQLMPVSAQLDGRAGRVTRVKASATRSADPAMDYLRTGTWPD